MASHLDKATLGEQSVGFFLGREGYFVVEGPGGTQSGKQGHAANAPGFDGVAYSVKRDDLIIYDNKAYKSPGNVASATAIDPSKNLGKNLNDLITRVKGIDVLPEKGRILDLLERTRATVTGSKVSPPANVRIAITGLGGNSSGVTEALAKRGLVFIDANAAPAVPPCSSRVYVNQATIPTMVQSSAVVIPGYSARVNRIGAIAAAVSFTAQCINDFSLSFAIRRKLRDLAAHIGAAIVRGDGVLVVVNIGAASPRGNVGVGTARSINSTYLIVQADADRQQALKAWERQQMLPRIERARAPHESREVRLLWIVAPDVQESPPTSTSK